MSLFLNNHRHELVKVDQKYHLKKVSISSSQLPFTELVYVFISISKLKISGYTKGKSTLNQTPRVSKSVNMGIWVVSTSYQLFTQSS